jgi:hypothetical protein
MVAMAVSSLAKTLLALVCVEALGLVLERQHAILAHP